MANPHRSFHYYILPTTDENVLFLIWMKLLYILASRYASVPFCPYSSSTKQMTDAFASQLIPQADYVVPVEIEWQWHNVYVIKRPGVDNFLKRMGELYEVVVFTASLSKVSTFGSALHRAS